MAAFLPGMRIVTVGVSHSSAPLSVLEEVSIPAGELDQALSRLKRIATEGWILSTCNRAEIVAIVADHASGASVAGDALALLDFLARPAGRTADELRGSSYAHAGAGAVRHALRVASGLDSMVLGEDQIQSQLRRALGAARTAGTLGPTLDRLGSTALACGKRVRTFTGLGHHSVSLESIAVETAIGRIGAVPELRAVVLGAGNTAASIVQQLKRNDARDITVVSRSHGNAEMLASESDVRSAPWDALPALLASVEMVFCCTSAPHPVLTSELLARRAGNRRGAPLLCVDLGMPRDVDASVAEIPGTTVISLDSLGAIAESYRAARRQHVPAAEAIVDRETQRFREWLDSRAAVGAITRLEARANSVADAELKRTFARLQALDARERAVVAEMAHRIARKLMHGSIDELKDHIASADVQAEEAAS